MSSSSASLADDDFVSSFSAHLQSSLAAEDTLSLEQSAHPQWELDGRRLSPEEGLGEEDGVFHGDGVEMDGSLVGEEVGEGAWGDWKELLNVARGTDTKKIREEVKEEAEKAVEAKPLKEALREKAATSIPPHPAATAEPAVLRQRRVKATPAVSPFATPVHALPAKQHRSGPLVLRPTERLTYTSFSPYMPLSLPTPSPPSAPVEPHHTPLLTRQDWRLSSPLRRFVRTSPPPLFSTEETATMPLGHGQLVGVGTGAARIARRGTSRTEEQWGWKVRVPEKEKGGWEAADAYVKRMTRLLTLSRASDERQYRSTRARSGTPQEREAKGITVCRAQGVWLSDTSKLEQPAVGQGQEEGRKKEAGAAGQRIVAEWRKEDGGELGEEHGYKFSEGTILRFTRSTTSLSSPSLDPTGPQPPLGGGALLDDQIQREEWFAQGVLLEEREGRLIVAFDQGDMWQLGEESYQIDIGLDTTAYALQEAALENLYLDPSRQRQRNAEHVQHAQQVFRQSSVAPSLREWTLQGTELRELLVPPLPAGGAAAEKKEKTPAAELASLPSPPASLLELDLALPAHLTTAGEALHPSDLLRSNQLINSWIRRYSREEPLVMPGDPDLGLNGSQMRAIAMALGERLSLIQGPPGTGKSQTIVSLIALLKLHFRVPFPILLAAPTHVSVDHLLSLLVRAGLNPLRCGKAAKVSTPEAEKWTIEKRQEQHPLWAKMEQAREESETARLGVLELREAVAVGEVEQKKAEKATFDLEERYRKAWRRFVMLEQKLYASLLATADVFCATALGSGASKVLSMVDFPLVLLDEAAMCTEPVSLIPLMKGAQHATFIGDHKQLPAVVTSSEAKNERLHISLFERLLASQNVKSTLLDTQYRMRPDISAFPNHSFYHSALRDAPSVLDRPPPLESRFFSPPTAPPPAPQKIILAPSRSPTRSPAAPLPAEPIPVAFVSHDGEERLHRQSTLNRDEVSLLVEIVGDLLQRNADLAASDIGIISPYYAQTRLLINTFESGFAASRLRKTLGVRRAAEVSEVEVNTVDGFQGREKAVILLSTVRSNPGGHIGFLTDRRRLNVALTRARDALIVVGNEQTLRRAAMNEWVNPDPDADAGVWRRFLQWCDRRGLVRQYKKEE
ncbi:hypothetical protein JCM10213_004695 [Rhodosporidiobolus nylandii]